MLSVKLRKKREGKNDKNISLLSCPSSTEKCEQEIKSDKQQRYDVMEKERLKQYETNERFKQY